MNGVVFHTSVRTITTIDGTRSLNQARSVLSRALTKPVVGSNANCQARAATTVTIP